MDNYDTVPYDPFSASRTTLPDGSTRYSPDGGQTFVVDKWDETRRGTVRSYQDASGNPIGAPEFLPAGKLSAGRSAWGAIRTIGGAALGANALASLAGGAAGAGEAALTPAVAGGQSVSFLEPAVAGATAPAVAGATAPAVAGATAPAVAGATSGLTWLAPIASVVGPAIAGAASIQAARTQAQGTQQAAQTQADVLNRQIALNEPWRQAGINALQRMQSGDIGLTQDPSYAFRFNEGMRALERLRAAGGKMYSGGTARAATEFGQNLASTEYGNAWNRLAQLAGIGQTATGAQTSATGTYGARAGDLTTSGAAARASGYVGPANILTQTFQNQQRQNFENMLLGAYTQRQPQQAPAAQAPTYGPQQSEDIYAPFRYGTST